MKKLLLMMLGVLIALPAMARDFYYTYEGERLTYTVIDEEAKTCKTKDGNHNYYTGPGNNVSGDLIIPAVAKDGENEYSVVEIGEYAFYKCSDLTSVTIPNSVTSIGENAFYGCSGLTSISIPNSVNYIDVRAFFGCSGLKSIIIEDGDTELSIYEDVFKDTPIEDVKIGRNWKSGSKAMTPYIKNLTLTDKVTAIPDAAFKHCRELTSVTIPNSVTEIGWSAFNGCSGLTSVTIPNSVTSIGGYAFYGCSGLKSLIIPNSVTSIEEFTFDGCSGLSSVLIPNSVTSIGNWAFQSCSGLVKSAYPSTINNPFDYGIAVKYPANGSLIEDGWVYSTDKSAIYFAPLTLEGECTIPSSVTSINQYTFYACSGLASVTIPNSVTSIDENAFSGCSGLTAVKAMPTMPADMVKSAFDNATYESALLTIPDGSLNDYYASTWGNFKNLRLNGANENVALYSDDVFKYIFSPGSKEAILVPGNYGSLSNASIPNRIAVENGEDATFYQVTEIGDNAFSGYTKISSIKLPKNLTKIGNGAFKGCTGFTEIELPTSLTTIGASAFENTRFASITLPVSLKTIGKSAFQNSELFSIAFPEGLESIGTAAFMNCASLTKVDLTNSSANIGSEAFMDCKALASIDFTKSSATIGDNAFKGCTALKNLVISDNITEIGKSAFMGCSSLEKVVTGNGTGTISSETFRNCTKLTDVTLGSKVKIIGPYAFEGCTALKNITLPSSVYAIDTYAFSGSGLNKTVIPEGVTDIASSAFYNCASLTSAEIGNGVAGLGDYAFANCSALTDVKLGNSLERIGNFAFDNCRAIASITIPASVTTIGENAFSYCSKLESISIPASVATIGKLAFMNCSAMKSFTLADGTSSIKLGESILNGTSIEKAHIGRDFNSTEFQGNSMKELTIGNTVTAVCDNAFKGCSNLTSLKLGATLESIGASAFQNCPLTDIVIPPSVESIGASAFDNNAIKSLAIGYGIKNIGENAFNGSNAIENIYITTVNPPSASNNTFSYYEAPLWLINQTAFDNYLDYPRCWYRFEDNMHPLKQINKISADKLSVSGKPGEVIKLDVTIMPADATLPNIFWKSTRPDLVSVDNEGNVTFLEEQGDIETYSTEECKIIAMTMYEDVPLLEVSVNVESSGIEDVIVDNDVQTGNDIDYNAPYQVYNLNGIFMGESLDGLATGFYIVRQGNNIRKIAVK